MLAMPGTPVVTGWRQHRRAPLSFPARLRWRGPLGMRFETVRTLDVSREGVLVRRIEPCTPGSRVWIALPFDSALANRLDAEFPARIVRVEAAAPKGYRVALRFELPPRQPARTFERERRASARVAASLPIAVRPASFPFPEETMTLDASRDGTRFETLHKYSCGDSVLAHFPWGGWTPAPEIPARVVRVDGNACANGAKAEASDESRLASVAIEWITTHKAAVR